MLLLALITAVIVGTVALAALRAAGTARIIAAIGMN